MKLTTEKKTRNSRVALACIAAFLVLGGQTAMAFVPIGPAATWQTANLGFQDVYARYPMNIGEEYRINVPTLYYGFTGDFMRFFGLRGAAEVDKAAKILNDLPPASAMNPDDYPMSSLRINTRAEAVGLIDIRSYTLSMLLNNYGIGDPTIRVFNIRTRWTTQNTTNFFVVMRNFDPITWLPTPYINGELWTYGPISIGAPSAANPAFANPAPVDPLALGGLRSLPVTAQGATIGDAPTAYTPVIGGFWTGLTRDDIGGLRFLYRKENYHVENSAPGAVLGGSGVGSGVFNPPGTVTIPGSPWGAPGGTNALTTSTNGIVGTNAATGTLINAAVRGGVEKISFIRVDYDSLIGGFLAVTNTASWTESVIQNSTATSQTLSRTIQVPDLIFDAGDLIGGDTGNQNLVVQIGLSAWDNNNDINGLNAALNFGPGVIPPGNGNAPMTTFTFNTSGLMLVNTYPNDSLNQAGSTVAVMWGSYDGTTNAPVVYPLGSVDIQALERRIGR